MSDHRASYRYALALLTIAEERRNVDAVSRDVGTVASLMREVKDFSLFLRSPVINIERKKRILSEILKDKVDEIILKFFMLLAAKGRLPLTSEIIRKYFELRDNRAGILHVSVRTVAHFTKEQERQLIGQIEKATRKTIHLHFLTEPSLIGGFTVQMDDTVWDASVHHQLELLTEKFVEGVG